MPDPRERRTAPKSKDLAPKERTKSKKILRQRPERVITEKFRRERNQSSAAENEERPCDYAGDTVERQTDAAFRHVGAAAENTVQRGADKAHHALREHKKEQSLPANGAQCWDASPVSAHHPPTLEKRMKQAAIREKRAQMARQVNDGFQTAERTAEWREAGSTASDALPGTPQTVRADGAGTFTGSIREKAVPANTIKEKLPGASTAPKVKPPAAMLRERSAAQAVTGAPAKATAKAAAGKAVQDAAQEQGQRLLLEQTKKAAKATLEVTKKIGLAVAHAVKALFSAVAALVGGGALFVSICIVMLVAAVVASPFGILFADQQKEPGAISPNAAIAQINEEYTQRLEEMQTGDYDGIVLHGAPPDWREVLAVFACKTAGANDGVDVATLDADRVERLRAVFWDMTPLRSEVETITHEDWTEYILHIYIDTKTVDDMRTAYRFTAYQNEALDALLDEMGMLGGLLGDLNITQEDAVALLENLPENLFPERRAVIQNALTLVGKLNYFWGGKSLTLGWDSRWGTTLQVTAAGSSSTGTYRPYGMDCSGFLDWVFYNASGGSYIIGHGGGASSQHGYCSTIAWSDAKPGDLVFYPQDSHVGIVGGRDEGGNLLIIHCASGANNVVITGVSGFVSIGRPLYYSE